MVFRLISNFRGVYTILEALKGKKRKFIQISTDEVFGTINEGSATEITRFNPSSPYAATKASAELLINSYIAASLFLLIYFMLMNLLLSKNST